MKEIININEVPNPRALNRKRFEYALMVDKATGLPLLYVHIDYYFAHKNEYINCKPVCPICHCDLTPHKKTTKQRAHWKNNKHHCYHQPTRKYDTGEVVFDVENFLEDEAEFPEKKEKGTGGTKGAGGEIETGEEEPIELTPIDMPAGTKISSAKDLLDCYNAGSGHVIASNGKAISEMICDQLNFTLWDGDLDNKIVLLKLVTCNYKKLPKQPKYSIWLKVCQETDNNNHTYILVSFKSKKNYEKIREILLQNRGRDNCDKSIIYIFCGLSRIENSSKNNLYRTLVKNYKCVYVIEGQDNDDNDDNE